VNESEKAKNRKNMIKGRGEIRKENSDRSPKKKKATWIFMKCNT
jgi:hypothetical protein